MAQTCNSLRFSLLVQLLYNPIITHIAINKNYLFPKFHLIQICQLTYNIQLNNIKCLYCHICNPRFYFCMVYIQNPAPHKSRYVTRGREWIEISWQSKARTCTCICMKFIDLHVCFLQNSVPSLKKKTQLTSLLLACIAEKQEFSEAEIRYITQLYVILRFVFCVLLTQHFAR